MTSAQHITPPRPMHRPVARPLGFQPRPPLPRAPQPPEHVRYPVALGAKAYDVTTCIAARVIGNVSALVFCTDMKGSVEWSSAETTYKWIPFGNFHALISGPLSAAKEVAQYCGSALLSLESARTQEAVTSALGRGFGKYKASYAERLVQSRFGVSYKEFRERGKSWLPEETYKSLYDEIHNHRSGSEIIIAGFLPFEKDADLKNPQISRARRPYIFKVSDEYAITCDDFATIGTGGSLAEASLMHRSQSIHHSIPATIYQCYEAKRMSEKAEAVGVKSRIIIVYGNNQAMELQGPGFEILDSHFARLSPQPVDKVEMLSGNYFLNVAV